MFVSCIIISLFPADFYEMKRDVLGRGAFAEVRACVNRASGEQLAVKVIEKRRALAASLECGAVRDSIAEGAALRRLRRRVHKEAHLFEACKNQPHVLQLREFFEDPHRYTLRTMHSTQTQTMRCSLLLLLLRAMLCARALALFELEQ